MENFEPIYPANLNKLEHDHENFYCLRRSPPTKCILDDLNKRQGSTGPYCGIDSVGWRLEVSLTIRIIDTVTLVIKQRLLNDVNSAIGSLVGDCKKRFNNVIIDLY